MRISVAFRQVMVAAAVLIPSVAFAQYGAPTSASPGPSFVWVGQWVPCNHPIAIEAGLGCVGTTPAPPPPPPTAVDDSEPPPPPTADVWGTTEAYSGVPTQMQVLL